jgi:hypothetical protein
LTLHVDGEANAFSLGINAAGYDTNTADIPVPITPKTIAYRRWTGFTAGDIYAQGWTDGYLVSGSSQTQAKFYPDTKSPKGTWATATTVNFAARPGQPATSRLTLQDGKSRTASGTLAWAVANGVADLGYDEAASQGNSKWLYFYAVPKSGDDNLFTVRASDNDPTTGPTGYTNFRLIWADYIDGSGNLAKIYQRGNKFDYPATIPKDLGTTADGAPVSLSLAVEVPASAAEVKVSALIQTSSANAVLALWVDGDQAGTRHSFAFTAATGSDVNETSIPTPTTPKVIYYQKTTGGTIAQATVYVHGWTDEWIDT